MIVCKRRFKENFGSRVNCKVIKDLKYADDTVIIADPTDEFQGHQCGEKSKLKEIMIIRRTLGLQIVVYDQLKKKK